METKTENKRFLNVRNNRFTGESIELTKEEAEKYDAIIANEYAATMEDKDRDDVGISSFWDLFGTPRRVSAEGQGLLLMIFFSHFVFKMVFVLLRMFNHFH